MKKKQQQEIEKERMNINYSVVINFCSKVSSQYVHKHKHTHSHTILIGFVKHDTISFVAYSYSIQFYLFYALQMIFASSV